MSTANYARMKASADRLITKFGQAATLLRPTSTGTAFNPTPGAPGEYPITVVVEVFSFREIDGTRIKRDDLKVLLAKDALTIEPATSDRLLIGGVEYAIMDVRPENPGGTTLMWTIQARR